MVILSCIIETILDLITLKESAAQKGRLLEPFFSGTPGGGEMLPFEQRLRSYWRRRVQKV